MPSYQLCQANLSFMRNKMALILGWALIRVRALISRRGLEGGSNTGTGPNSGTGSNSDNYGNHLFWVVYEGHIKHNTTNIISFGYRQNQISPVCFIHIEVYH